LWRRCPLATPHHSNTPTLRESTRRGGVQPRPVRAPAVLHVRVAGAQHRGEPRRFLFAPPLLARFLKMPMGAHGPQSAFAVQLLLQPPQRLLHRLAFLKPNLGQYSLTSSPTTPGHPAPSWPRSPVGQAAKDTYGAPTVNQNCARNAAKSRARRQTSVTRWHTWGSEGPSHRVATNKPPTSH
jgi:hypothetical protein